MDRLDRHARIMELREQGMAVKEIGPLMGLTESGVRSLLSDPDGSKQKKRRERYQGTCERCGTKTDGSGGFKDQPQYCAACTAILRYENRRWPKEAVIEAILTWAAENGRPPVSTDWITASEDGRFPGMNAVYRSKPHSISPFASWADAIEAAGFPRPRHGLYQGRTDWTPERIIEAFQAFASEHGRSPKTVDLPSIGVSQWTVQDRFGGVPEALDAAGLPRNKSGGREWTREQIVSGIQQFAREHGRPPKAREWQEKSGDHPWPPTVMKRFGSWNNAIAAAGFTPRPRRGGRVPK